MEKLTVEKQLTKLESRILELYAKGKAYHEIQLILMEEFGENLDKRKLGFKMGEIKHKMECNTQFHMGYIYANNETAPIMERLKEEVKDVAGNISEKSYKKGYRDGKENALMHLTGKDLNKGLNIGAVGATIFWLFIFWYVYSQILSI